jgi:hypothetical protein
MQINTLLYIFQSMVINMKVSNPLTIIAIFAGIAETLATVALVQLPPEIQSIFVYFVMVFPSAIVLLFFCVLYFKNTVLYAPSDFENQNHYLEANQIKENINYELDKIFKRLNAGGTRLTKEEIDNAKNSVERAVDTTVTLSRTQKNIFEFLSSNSASEKEICEYFEFDNAIIIKYLFSMKSMGLIQKENGKWCVNV